MNCTDRRCERTFNGLGQRKNDGHKERKRERKSGFKEKPASRTVEYQGEAPSLQDRDVCTQGPWTRIMPLVRNAPPCALSSTLKIVSALQSLPAICPLLIQIIIRGVVCTEGEACIKNTQALLRKGEELFF